MASYLTGISVKPDKKALDKEFEKIGLWKEKAFYVAPSVKNSAGVTIKKLHLILNDLQELKNALPPEVIGSHDILVFVNNKGVGENEVNLVFYIDSALYKSTNTAKIEKELTYNLFINIWVSLHPEISLNKNSDVEKISNVSTNVLYDMNKTSFLQVTKNGQ